MSRFRGWRSSRAPEKIGVPKGRIAIMTTRTWIGGTGSFDNPNEWSPGGVPGAGDVAIISIGEATLSMQKLDGFELQLQYPASVLDISDVIFGKSFTLSAPE